MLISLLLNVLLLQITWNPDPVVFSVGKFSLRWYGLMWGLAVFLGFQTTLYLFKQKNLATGYVAKLVEYVFFGGLIGARLGQVLFYELDYFMRYPTEILQIWKGGLASHGGAIGIVAAIYFYCRNYKYPYMKILDVLSVGAPLCGALIRFGNLMNSEIVGKTTSVPWGFEFVRRGEEFARHPSQLYECIWAFLVFVGLYFLSKKKLNTGMLTGLFFVFGFGGRILLEFFKEDAFTTQLLSLPFVAMGIVIIYWARRGKYEVSTSA